MHDYCNTIMCLVYTLTINIDLLLINAMGPHETNFRMKLNPINSRISNSIVRYTYNYYIINMHPANFVVAYKYKASYRFLFERVLLPRYSFLLPESQCHENQSRQEVNQVVKWMVHYSVRYHDELGSLVRLFIVLSFSYVLYSFLKNRSSRE